MHAKSYSNGIQGCRCASIQSFTNQYFNILRIRYNHLLCISNWKIARFVYICADTRTPVHLWFTHRFEWLFSECFFFAFGFYRWWILILFYIRRTLPLASLQRYASFVTGTRCNNRLQSGEFRSTRKIVKINKMDDGPTTTDDTNNNTYIWIFIVILVWCESCWQRQELKCFACGWIRSVPTTNIDKIPFY